MVGYLEKALSPRLWSYMDGLTSRAHFALPGVTYLRTGSDGTVNVATSDTTILLRATIVADLMLVPTTLLTSLVKYE